ncbi:hypothetical protein BH11ARM1_BH11ARM1_16660 [soil metagenome]
MKCGTCGEDFEGDICLRCGPTLKPPIVAPRRPHPNPRSEYVMIAMIGIPSLIMGSCCILSVTTKEITTAQPGWFMNAVLFGFGGIGIFCFVMVWALRSLKRP